MRIVLGLGNPGRRYERTRHNVGFRTVETLAEGLGVSFSSGGGGPPGADAAIAHARVRGEEIVIAKPLTMMNRSGAAAARLAALYAVSPSEFVVAYDDVALALGTIRIRASGRSAGQQGMESVLRTLGTDEIPRVRLGILGERGDADLADYVLEPFLPAEREAAEAMIDRASTAILSLLERGIAQTMNAHNRREEGPE